MSPSPFDCWLFEDNEWATLSLLWKCLPPWQRAKGQNVWKYSLCFPLALSSTDKSHIKKLNWWLKLNVHRYFVASLWQCLEHDIGFQLTYLQYGPDWTYPTSSQDCWILWQGTHPAFAEPDLSVMITQLFSILEQYCVVRGCETEGGLSWMIWVPYQVALQHIHSQIQISKSSAQAQARLKM